MTEVEIKAWLKDPESVAKRVAADARFLRNFDKHDEYWHGSGWESCRNQKGFRIRNDNGLSVITFKKKRIEHGIEVNKESEFEISDYDAFVEFITRLGCEFFYKKRKTGTSWDVNGITVEISHIENLGNFIEIESVIESDDSSVIRLESGKIRTLLFKFGVDESSIESRPYSALLLDDKFHA